MAWGGLGLVSVEMENGRNPPFPESKYGWKIPEHDCCWENHLALSPRRLSDFDDCLLLGNEPKPDQV